MTPTPSIPNYSKAAKAILLAGLLAGILDGTAAVILTYISQDRGATVVFQYVASAIVGADVAFSGGISMALLGLVFHFIIATIWALVFFILYPFFYRISKNKILNGIVYGLFIWLVMNLIIVPITKAPQAPITLSKATINILIIMFMVGIPISFITHRYYSIKQH